MYPVTFHGAHASSNTPRNPWTAKEKFAILRGEGHLIEDPKRRAAIKRWVKANNVKVFTCSLCRREFVASSHQVQVRGDNLCAYCYKNAFESPDLYL